ncbi:DUF5693 family protein [Marinitoga lauensis]|uniref:DUF5693 family protein n=1 Tax=Marinitoga lauensis TaxID=2201189 RepID=UPI0010124D23|nr:DUF5693 family protein [Marinitoga lauensis]
MKKRKKIIFILVVLYSIGLFVYISFTDFKYLKSGYHIIDNNVLIKQSIKINNKNIDYYKYQDYILISENSTNITLNDFKGFVSHFNNILIAEFSDFGYLFDRYKVSLNKSELNRIRYVHYIKPKEMDKYNVDQIVQRFWRAFNERRINIFYIPDHFKREKIIIEIKNKINNYNESIPNLIKVKDNISFLTAVVNTVFLTLYVPILAIIFLIMYIYFNPWSYVFLAIIYSFLSWIYWKKRFEKNKKILYAILLNILFGMLIYGTGYKYFYIYKISVIRGIKLLLITLPFVLFLVQIKNFKMKKKDIILSSVMLGVIAIYYILRSGNFGFSTMFERNIRDFLERTLIARPRFKELFAYLFVFTKPPTKFFEIFWNIGQSILFVSILDTFLHFQTPIYLGVLRTVNAFIIAYIVYKILSLMWREKNGKRN